MCDDILYLSSALGIVGSLSFSMKEIFKPTEQIAKDEINQICLKKSKSFQDIFPLHIILVFDCLNLSFRLAIQYDQKSLSFGKFRELKTE